MAEAPTYILMTATAKAGPPWRGIIRRADFKGDVVDTLYGETEAEILAQWANWLAIHEPNRAQETPETPANAP